LVIPLKTKTLRRFFSTDDLRIVRSVHEVIQKYGLNFEGIRRLLALLPCWDMKPCCEGAHRTCIVPKVSDRPCWMVENTICRQMELDCRSCPVYRRAGDILSLKKVIFGERSGPLE
jgi:MerR family transcriptional regulator/heat shock protein HspR